jgi:amino acid transporter
MDPVSSRERARRLHFVLLAVLGAPAFAFASFLMIESDRSASAMSGLAAAVGIAIVATLVAYALATTLVVRLFARTPRDTVVVHVVAPLLGALALLLAR